MAYVQKKEWLEHFKHCSIVGVTVRTKTLLAVVARRTPKEASEWWEPDVPTIPVSINLERPKENCCGGGEYTGVAWPSIATARHIGLPYHTLVSNRNSRGEVIPMGGGREWAEEFIFDFNLDKTVHAFSCKRLKSLGPVVYAVGVGRGVFCRVGVNQWQDMGKNLNAITRAEQDQADRQNGGEYVYIDDGFADIDQFTPTDMYAAGGAGDVWRFDGQQWIRVPFPSNEQLSTVCCAGDGYVYIGGEGCSLWRGREDTWEKVAPGGSSILWNDMRWFNGQLYCASDYNFRVWDGKELNAVTHKGERVPISGHMDAADGVLVVAGGEYVMRFDGQDWMTVVAPWLS